MSQRPDLPKDPTRKIRRLAIQNTLDRVNSIMTSSGSLESTPDTIAEQANSRIARTKKLKEG